MKIRKFIFKFVNHENQTIHCFEFDIHSSKVHQWTQMENDVDGYVKWVAHHARWEKHLKKEVKEIIKNKFPKFGEIFHEYVLVCEKSCKKSKNINTNRNPGAEMHFVQLFCMEKCVLKFVKGLGMQKSKGPEKVLDMLKYKKYHEIIHLEVEDNENEIILRPIHCQKGNEIVIPQDFNNQNMGSRNFMSRSSMAQPENIPSYMKGTNAATLNKSLNRNTLNVGSNMPYVGTTDNQLGGHDWEEKYQKYKEKYLRLKNNY